MVRGGEWETLFQVQSVGTMAVIEGVDDDLCLALVARLMAAHGGLS